MVSSVEIILYIVLGCIIGIVYSLRRVIMLERRILNMDYKLSKLFGKRYLNKIPKPKRSTKKRNRH